MTFQEFENFCNTVLRRMRYCNVGGIILKKYTASCKTAIEEFYSNSNTAAADDAAASTSDGAAAAFSSSPQVSFHLEVALFCIGAVADDAMTSTPHNCSTTTALAAASSSSMAVVAGLSNGNNDNTESEAASSSSLFPAFKLFWNVVYRRNCIQNQ